MRGIKVNFILLIFSLIFLSACTKPNEEMQKYLDTSPIDERHYIIDKAASELFIETFEIKDLEHHETYYVENEFCINLKFGDDVSRSNVRRSLDYFTILTLQSGLKMTAIPYQEILYGQYDLSRVTVRIFSEETLLIYWSFDFIDHKTDFYENMALDMTDRKMNDEKFEPLISSMMLVDPSIKSIKVVKPFKPYVYIFEVQVESIDNEKTIETLKRHIEDKVALKLEKESIEVYGMNTNSLGLVLDIRENKYKSKRFLYYNGLNKKWIDENWMAIDFFSLYSDER